MGQILGSITLRLNGKQIKTKKGWTLNASGFNATDHLGPNKSWGKSYEYVNPTLSGPIAADEDVDVLDINAIRNATIVWEGDNGVEYLIVGCSPQNPFTLSDSGDINGTFSGDKMSRV
ncbi:TPA: phage tail tube protein [Vibrio cholerae]|nr:phage tail tube protein [Vibrio cholerae]